MYIYTYIHIYIYIVFKIVVRGSWRANSHVFVTLCHCTPVRSEKLQPGTSLSSNSFKTETLQAFTMYVCTHVYIYMYNMYTYTYIYTLMYMYIYIYICMCSMHICIYIYIYMCGGFAFLYVNKQEGIHWAKTAERTLFADHVWLSVSHSRHVCCVTQQTCVYIYIYIYVQIYVYIHI